jgi:hypothetical protein
MHTFDGWPIFGAVLSRLRWAIFAAAKIRNTLESRADPNAIGANPNTSAKIVG